MKKEMPYEYREKLLVVHEPNLRRPDRPVRRDEYLLESGIKVKISANAGVVTSTAANDFLDYLRVSMGVTGELVHSGEAQLTVELAEQIGVDMGEFKAYKGFWIESSDAGISVIAHDERGAAQALYYLEDMMTFEQAPVVKHGSVKKKALFSPQMFHSGYERQVYPDEYLMRMAHEGRDAIIVDVGETEGCEDYANELISRCERYGMDVYAYIKFKSRDNVYPEGEEAQRYYDSKYGALFKNCPGLRGIVLVGESIEFPSRDPHVSEGFHNQTAVDGIPTGKKTAGWYPCFDYPLFLEMIQKAVYKYCPEADIVFWTYNWFSKAESGDLIRKLPKGISLMSTFELYQPVAYGKENAKDHVADYTLTFQGPCDYFLKEARVARECGIRLYSMTNTGGNTWDFGVIPYEPMPQQWMRRYKAMQEAHKEFGLCGIMESHDYGVVPSFITKLSKHAFMTPAEPMDDILEKIVVSEFGRENSPDVIKGLDCFSEGIKHLTPTVADQYGAFRIGPSYPFNLFNQLVFPGFPRGFAPPVYNEYLTADSPLSLRIHPEIESLEKMLGYMEAGLEHMCSAPRPNDKLDKLINLGRFISSCVKTGINSKKWYVLGCRLKSAFDAEAYANVLVEMEQLLALERENVLATIPLVEADSSLGLNISIENAMKNMLPGQETYYLSDKKHLEWKLKQLDYMTNNEMKRLKGALEYHLSDDIRPL